MSGNLGFCIPPNISMHAINYMCALSRLAASDSATTSNISTPAIAELKKQHFEYYPVHAVYLINQILLFAL